MKSTLVLIALCLPLLLGCQKSDLNTQGSGEAIDSVGTTTVRAANGVLYAISCLRDHADEIHQNGKASLDQCKVNPSTGEGRQFFHGGGSAYFVFWPPKYYSKKFKATYYPTSNTTYYPPVSQTYYPPVTTTPSYSSTSTSSNPFCSYVFGASTSLNCYYLFGYNTNYQTYYQPSCTNSCMYSYNPSTCQNSCWSNYSWNQ